MKQETVLSEEKQKHEEKRTKLLADIQDMEQKWKALGVTVNVYEPGEMRLLAYLLKKKARSKTKSTGLKKANKTRNFKSIFGEKRLLNQSNPTQQQNALILFNLFRKINITSNCVKGASLVADLQENENKPSRYIFLFLRKIDGKDHIVGFVSGSKQQDNDEHGEVDYVCTKLDFPPNESGKWTTQEATDNFAGYAVLKLLWLNNDKGKKKYADVVYKNVAYETPEKVFQKLITLKSKPAKKRSVSFLKVGAE